MEARQLINQECVIIQDVLEEINKRYNEDEDAPGMVDVVDDINFLLTLAGYVKKDARKTDTDT